MRRGHGSTKVPGVKLRPAAPLKSGTSASKQKKQPSWQDTTGDDFDPSEIIKASKKPFQGAVICASSVADKATLYHKATQLGAQTSSDLTDSVTHLICNGPGSAKYQYCAQHGIPLVLPSWIEDSYNRYLDGDDVDVQTSLEAHRLPTFTSVHLCCTAVPEDSRARVADAIEKNGGIFLPKIERKTTMTHLLCGGERGENVDARGWTPKMLYVEKLGRGIKMVWEEWFWDCLEFKGLLDENDYSVDKPRPARRKTLSSSPLADPIPSNTNSFLTDNATPNSSFKRQRSIPASIPSSSLLVSGDKEEMASVKRLPETTNILWKGLLKSRGIEVTEGKLKRSPSKNAAMRSETSSTSSNPKDRDSTGSSAQGSSLTAAFKRTKSFAIKSEHSDAAVGINSTHRAHSTLSAATITTPGAGPSTLKPSPSAKPEPIPEGERSLFSGKRFKLLGDANDSKVVEAIRLRGGVVLSEGDGDEDSDVDFKIVRLASGTPHYISSPSESSKLMFRTECWIEQCIYEERLCARDEHPAFKPLDINLPIGGAEKLKIHVSGLSAVEKTMAVRLSRAIGITVTEHLSRKNTHLLCPSATGPKFDKALDWAIPVVTLEWLYAIALSGRIYDVEEYLVAFPIRDIRVQSNKDGEKAPIIDITNAKGKGSEAPSSGNNSKTEFDEGLSLEWKSNGLLDDPVEAVRTTTPRKSSLILSSSNRPVTPSRSPRKPSLSTSLASAENLPVTSPIRLGKVPSSVTPSPLKLPVASEPTSTSAQSPSTATLSSDSANVLKEAITSLLGKRNSSTDDVIDSSEESKGRNLKRARPVSRNKSRQGTFSRATSSDNLGLSRANTTSSHTDYPLYIQENIKPLEENSHDESIRVMYEDPSQKNEQIRLMNLINNEPLEEEKGKKSSRRSSRVKSVA